MRPEPSYEAAAESSEDVAATVRQTPPIPEVIDEAGAQDEEPIPPHDRMEECAALGFDPALLLGDLQTQAVHGYAGNSHAPVPIMWMPVLVPANWLSTCPSGQVWWPAVTSFPSPPCMAPTLLGAVPARASESWRLPSADVWQSVESVSGAEALVRGQSLASNDSSEEIAISQVNSPGRRRSERGRQRQLERWQQRLAVHAQRMQQTEPNVVPMDDQSFCASEARESLAPKELQADRVCQAIGWGQAKEDEHTGDKGTKPTGESATDAQEVRARPTFRVVLCCAPPRPEDAAKRPPWRAVSVREQQDALAANTRRRR